jgi:hypothetical protein
MSDASIFVLIFAGLLVLRVAAATVIFYYILPPGDRCPLCDAATVRVQAGRLNRLLPNLRSSWCMECGWTGMLRSGPLTPQDPTATAGRLAGVIESRGEEKPG